jgi:hypothetical protein
MITGFIPCYGTLIDDKPLVLSGRQTAVLELLMRRNDRVPPVVSTGGSRSQSVIREQERANGLLGDLSADLAGRRPYGY